MFKYKKLILSLAFIFSTSLLVCGQTKTTLRDNDAVKSTPAYAEVLLRQTELQAELEDLLFAYTDEFPKVKEIRIELDMLKQDMRKMFLVRESETSKLSVALGKLMLRRAELETDLWNLRQTKDDEHPDIKKMLRKISIFNSAINDILK